MMNDLLIRAWLLLIALSAGSTALALAVPGLTGPALAVAGAAILTLAWLKARVILSDYLGLRAAPFWRRGFGMVLGFYMIGLLGLYLIPAL